MQRIDINLVPVRKDGGLTMLAIAAAMAAVAIALSAYSLNAYSINMGAIERAQGRIAALGGAPQDGVQDHKALKRDAEVVNGYVDKKVFSWTGLLTALEETLPPGVRLLQVSPEFGRSAVRISGAAQGMDDVLKAVEAMGRGRFEEVFLTRHSKDKGGAVFFSITARYRGGR